MVIIETTVFTKTIKKLMSDDDYRSLQEALVIKPDRGALIKNSSGLRKLRWSLEGRGKSGGARIIYYWAIPLEQVYMLLAYPKNEQDNLTDKQLHILKAIVERWTK